MSTAIKILLIITTSVVFTDAKMAGNFLIEAGKLRTDVADSHESVPIASTAVNDNLACSFECFIRQWCRAANVNHVAKQCDLFVMDVYDRAVQLLATDNSSYSYAAMYLDPPFPISKQLPNGFPVGSRVSVTFKAAGRPLQLNFNFHEGAAGGGGIYFPLILSINQEMAKVVRQSSPWGSLEFDRGFPFDEFNVWQVKILMVNVSSFAINVNGTPFITYNTPLNTSRIDRLLINGAVMREPFEVSIEVAA